MAEKADHTSTPSAGFGYLWTKNTVPATLIFTDDAGTDFNLSASGSGDILANGTVPMTASWSMGGFGISSVGTIGCTTITCTVFTSNGIDDNASGERLELADTYMGLGTTADDFNVFKPDNNGTLNIYGGASTAGGSGISLKGTGASGANDIVFWDAGGIAGLYDSSKGQWDFQAKDIVTTGNIFSDVSTGLMQIAGGNTASAGGRVYLYGVSHATQASDIEFLGSGGVECHFDNSASAWDFKGNAVINASAGYNNQTGTTYTIVAADNGKILTFDNAASIAVTLPDTLDTNFQCTIVQVGAGVPTVTPATDTINGAGTGVAPSAQWKGMYLSQYSATNWLALL